MDQIIMAEVAEVATKESEATKKAVAVMITVVAINMVVRLSY